MDGIKIYSFKYKNKSDYYVGVMAQDLLPNHSDKVITNGQGFYEVFYSKLGLKMISLNEWKNNPSSIYI